MHSVDIFKCAAIADRISENLREDLNPAEQGEVIAVLAAMLSCGLDGVESKAEAMAVAYGIASAIGRRTDALWDANAREMAATNTHSAPEARQ